MSKTDEQYMARCLQLARGGEGHTRSNPMVGAVLVRDGRIIGEGYHRRYGEAHAEVNAIAAVKEEAWLREATLYVSLEPCSHYGKTPPCAELIVRKQIPRVVVGCLDPFPEVAGRGVALLREAGIEVVTGVLEKEARELNKFFITLQTQGRPYVILKWAQSADGYMDRIRRDRSEPPARLSSPQTMRRVHQLRARVGAILVGTRTALLDDPSLTVRHWAGISPLRVTIDRKGLLPPGSRLFDGSAETVVFTACPGLERPGVSYVYADFTRPLLPQLLGCLASRRVDSLLVEGGAGLLASFLDAELWDEAHVETAPFFLGGGVKAPSMAGKYSPGCTEIWPDDGLSASCGLAGKGLRTVVVYTRRGAGGGERPDPKIL